MSTVYLGAGSSAWKVATQVQCVWKRIGNWSLLCKIKFIGESMPQQNLFAHYTGSLDTHYEDRFSFFLRTLFFRMVARRRSDRSAVTEAPSSSCHGGHRWSKTLWRCVKGIMQLVISTLAALGGGRFWYCNSLIWQIRVISEKEKWQCPQHFAIQQHLHASNILTNLHV